jgi:hypothetical protein
MGWEVCDLPSHSDAHEPLLMRRIRIHAAAAEEVAAAAAW